MENNYAATQAESQLTHIVEMVQTLKDAQENQNDELLEEAETAIQESPLCIEVRSGWGPPCDGGEAVEMEEFRITLCTDGPAVQIIGKLDIDNVPLNAELQYQDWGTPWITRYTNEADSQSLLTYAQQFFFEG